MKKLRYSTTSRVWPLVGFLAITLFFFKKAIFSNFVTLSVTGDSYLCIYSWSHYFIWAVKQGIFPLWNSLNLCGHPFGTEAPSNFNILNLLNLFLSPNAAWNIRHIHCVFLAGYFMFLFARSVNINRFSSFACGAVYMFTNSVIDAHLHTTTFMVPLIFLMLDKAIRKKRYTWLSLASILMTIYYLNSNPQFVLYIFIFSCGYIIFRYCSLREQYRIKELAGFVGIFALLTFGLSSLQILRTLEITQDSSRVILKEWYSVLLPTHLIKAIFPYFYESPFRGELNFFFGRMWIEIIKRLPPLFGKPGIAPPHYLGVIPLVLGILAFLKRRKKAIEQFFGWSAIAVLIYMSTSFLSHIIIRYIPILNQMFQNQRSYIVYEFSLALLAGCGMNTLLNESRNMWQTALKNINKVVLLVLGIAGFILSALHAILIWKKGLFMEIANGFVNKYIIGSPAYIAPPELYYFRVKQLYNMLYSWTNILGPSFYISAIIIFFSVLILYIYTFGLIRKKVFKILIFFVVVGDLFFIMSPRLPFSPPEEVIPEIEAGNFLAKQAGIFRVLPLQDIRDLSKPMNPKTFLRSNTNLIYGISSPEGLQSIIMRRYADLMRKSANKDMTGLIGEVENFNQHIANLMNIKYVVTSTNRVLCEPFKLVYEDKEHRIYENLEVFSRAFIVHRHLVLSNEEDILAALMSEAIPLDKIVILEETPQKKLNLQSSDYSLDSKAEIEEYAPHSIVIDVDMKTDGYLVLSDCYFPGWEVHIDGKPDKIYRADYVFRAVPLPEGKHKVHFIYRPFSVKLGSIFILLTLFAIAGIIIKERHRANE